MQARNNDAGCKRFVIVIILNLFGLRNKTMAIWPSKSCRNENGIKSVFCIDVYAFIVLTCV